jgi:endonuclease YncB( thermonuclease family)
VCATLCCVRRFLVSAAVSGLCLDAAPALAAETIVGYATIVDGRTIEIEGTPIRLYGIDAPDLDQQCRRPGERSADFRVYACGQEAKAALERIIGGIVVTCESREDDGYDGAVARCWRGERFSRFDLAREMVREGWAVADRESYLDDEADARAAHKGLWAGQFEDPERWRQRRKTY